MAFIRYQQLPILLVIFLLCNSGRQGLFAQPVWKQRADYSLVLPEGLKLFELIDTNVANPLHVWCLQLDLRSKRAVPEVICPYDSLMTPPAFYALLHQPLIMMNAGFSNDAGGRMESLLMQNEIVCAFNKSSLRSNFSDSFYYFSRAALGISRHRKADIAWVLNDSSGYYPRAFQQNPVVYKDRAAKADIKKLQQLEYWKWWRMKLAFGGGPVLIQRGKIKITYREEQIPFAGRRDRLARTAVGYTRKNRLIMVFIEGPGQDGSGGANLQQTAAIMQSLGCREAMQLNYGNSSFLYVQGKPVFQTTDDARVPALITIRSVQAKAKKK